MAKARVSFLGEWHIQMVVAARMSKALEAAEAGATVSQGLGLLSQIGPAPGAE